MSQDRGAIYAITTDGTLAEVAAEEYESEQVLQELLALHPQLLPGKQIDSESPRRWLLVSREVGIGLEPGAAGRWSLDHLFLDQDGVPTLVEVKRSTNTEIRRDVVGQMLDYAANALVYWPVQTVQELFGRTCEKRNLDPDMILTEFLGQSLTSDQFWDRVKTNLQAGRIRLVFIADVIPQELQRIVEFLNSQMDPAEVLAIEIQQYASANLRVLVPRLLGQTAQAQERKTGKLPARKWDSESFFTQLSEEVGLPQAQLWKELRGEVLGRGAIEGWGSGSRTGSWIVMYEHTEPSGRRLEYYPVFVSTNGAVHIQCHHLLRRPIFEAEDLRREFVRRLAEISGVKPPENAHSKWWSFRIESLAGPG